MPDLVILAFPAKIKKRMDNRKQKTKKNSRKKRYKEKDTEKAGVCVCVFPSFPSSCISHNIRVC